MVTLILLKKSQFALSKQKKTVIVYRNRACIQLHAFLDVRSYDPDSAKCKTTVVGSGDDKCYEEI